MAETTGIAWCDSTFNPWIGCTKVGPGCDHCYAEALDKRHKWSGATHWGAGVPRLRTSAANWAKPLAWNRARAKDGKTHRVFCASLADVFDNDVPLRWRQDLMDLVADTPHLTWLFLTKRIGMARRLLSGASDHRSFFLTSNDDYKPPANLWIGATIVNQEEADRDVPKLLATPAAVRFVSYEPALGPVNFSPWLSPKGHVNWGENKSPSIDDQRAVLAVAKAAYKRLGGALIDWIIVGGESTQGAKARPFERAWARSVIEQCRATDAAPFVKQLGSNVQAENGPGGCDIYAPRFRDRAGADPAEWPADLRVQEFPA